MFLSAALSSILVLVGAGPASAHTGFESSDPVDGTTVEVAVDEVTIAFSGAAEPAGEGFVVLDPLGTVRTPDTVAADAEQLRWTLGFNPPLTDGVVGVRWTVQAPDAHPISGSFSFTVTAAAPTETAASVGSGSEQAQATTTAPATATVDTDGNLEASSSDPLAAGVAQAAAQGDSPATEGSDLASEGADLDGFLQQTDPSVPNAAGVGAFGRLLGFVGTMLGIGGLCFAAVVVRSHRRDLRSVLKAVRFAAAVVVTGTVIDLVAHLAVANNGWGNVLAVDAVESVAVSAFGLAVGLRMTAGVLLFAAAKVTHKHLGRVEHLLPERDLVLASGPSPTIHGDQRLAPDAGPPDDDRFWEDWADWDRWSADIGELRRPVPAEHPIEHGFSPSAAAEDQAISIGSAVAVLVLLASFTFDGHTVTEGNRFVTAAVDMVHVVAASIWAGGVVAFAVVLWRRYRRGEPLNGLEMALRFSVIAGAALAVAGVAGTVLAAIILDSVSELWTTPWGRLLMAKTAAVVAAASLGSFNHFVVIPWMNAHPDDDARSVRIRNTATGEAILLIVVIAVTAFLVGASSQP